MSDKRRVVVTGLGLVTPVGLDVEETWDALIAGRSGGGPITQFDASDQSVRFACEVKDYDPEQFMDRKEARRADRFLHLVMGAAHQATEQAAIEAAVEEQGALGSSQHEDRRRAAGERRSRRTRGTR